MAPHLARVASVAHTVAGLCCLRLAGDPDGRGILGWRHTGRWNADDTRIRGSLSLLVVAVNSDEPRDRALMSWPWARWPHPRRDEAADQYRMAPTVDQDRNAAARLGNPSRCWVERASSHTVHPYEGRGAH